MIKIYTLMLLLLFVFGCTNDPPEHGFVKALPLGESIKTFRAQQVPFDPNEQVESIVQESGVLTLNKAMALALLHSPQLQSFSWQVRRTQALRIQAGLWPNPQIDIEMENIAGSGQFRSTSSAETFLGISQVLEIRKKRKKRTLIADLNSKLTGFNYEMRRLQVLTEVSLAFVDVLALEESIDIVNQQVKVAEKVFNTVHQRVQAGKDAPLEEVKARIALTQSQIEQKKLQKKLPGLRLALAAKWGAKQARFTRVHGSLNKRLPLPKKTVLQSLVKRHPSVMRWNTEIQQRQARIALAKANALGNPVLMAGYRRFNDVDESAFVVGLSVPLPVTNRNQGNIIAAKAARAQAVSQRTAAVAEIQIKLALAYSDLSSSYDAADDLELTVLPNAQKAFESAETGYQNGKFDYLTVLDAQRTLFTVKNQYINALADFHKAKAQVQQLIGQSLDSLERKE